MRTVSEICRTSSLPALGPPITRPRILRGKLGPGFELGGAAEDLRRDAALIKPGGDGFFAQRPARLGPLDGVPLGSSYTWQFTLMTVFGNLLVGFVLFFGAEYIVALAYPAPDEVDEARRF